MSEAITPEPEASEPQPDEAPPVETADAPAEATSSPVSSNPDDVLAAALTPWVYRPWHEGQIEREARAAAKTWLEARQQ